MDNKSLDLTRIFFLTVSVALIISAFIFSETAGAVIGSSLVLLGLTVLDILMPKIAKLSPDNPKIKTMRRINRLILFVLVVITVIQLFVPIESLFSSEKIELLQAALVALFIMVLGNSMPKIPFNRYMGLRLPWTIRDEDTWKIAHRLAGYLSFPCGLMLLVGAFFFPVKTVAATSILTWIIIPGLYSLGFYMRKYRH